MNSIYTPLQRDWSAVKLFENIKPGDVRLSDTDKKNYREFLLCDLRAESDASNLYEELMKNYKFSKEFNDFLEIWYRDEINHASGFRKVIHLLFGDDENELDREMRNRKADFSKLQSFFQDEFKLCVLFAYDEHASTLTYQKDVFYRTFGPPEFVQWIINVTRDEARHFGNAIKLIHHKFKDRLSETREVLNEILAFENSGESYKATFLFDHDTEHFLLTTEELNTKCVDWVYKKIISIP